MVHRILLIDDEKVFLTSIAAYLKAKGLEVYQAKNGKEGLKIVEKNIPDIIITDWHMPKLSGIDILNILQNNDSTQDIPIIVSSGILIEADNLEAAFSAGAVDFIRKPIDKIELLARINCALRLADSNKKLRKETAELKLVNEKLKRLQGQLIHNEKMNSLGQLTSGVAHEINNPLNFVLGGAEAINVIISDLHDMLLKLNGLNLDSLSKEDISNSLKEIQEELQENNSLEDLILLAKDVQEGGQRIMRIVRGLSAFAQIKNTGVVLGNIHEGLNAALMLLTNQFQDRITVKKNFDTNIPQFEADHGALNQVFLNLLTNAIQAIPNIGTIQIETLREKDDIHIVIEDSGKGMPEHMVDRIFYSYFSVESKSKGYGIGLSVSYNIIKEHGGNMACISNEGKGTRFSITLPLERITRKGIS